MQHGNGSGIGEKRNSDRRAGGFLLIAGAVAAGALALGVPLGTIFVIGLLLLCPLMMMGMHGHGGHTGREDDHPTDQGEAIPHQARPPERTQGDSSWPRSSN